MWSWRPWAGVKLRKMRRGDGDNNAWSPGRARISRKPIAQGRPVDRLVPVVPAPCIFSHGGHGCGSHPVFPAPSVSEEGGLVGKTRTPRAARMRTNILLVVMPAKAGIQYAAASRLKHSASGILDRPDKPGDDGGEGRAQRQILMVRSAATPRVSNHVAPVLAEIIPSHRAEYFAACQGLGNRSEKSETRSEKKRQRRMS